MCKVTFCTENDFVDGPLYGTAMDLSTSYLIFENVTCKGKVSIAPFHLGFVRDPGSETEEQIILNLKAHSDLHNSLHKTN